MTKDNQHNIRILHHKKPYQGYFSIESFELMFRRYKGSWSKVIKRELFERGVAAAILPYDPDREQVVLIEQFRIGALKDKKSAWLLEIVAGVIMPGEKPEKTAYRETQEETGLSIKKLLPITTYWVSPGGSSESISLFCGQVDASQADSFCGLARENEDIKVIVLNYDAALAKVASGEIRTAPAIIALQWLALNKHRLL